MDTTATRSGAAAQKKKGRVFTRPFGTFHALEVSCDSSGYLVTFSFSV